MEFPRPEKRKKYHFILGDDIMAPMNWSHDTEVVAIEDLSARLEELIHVAEHRDRRVILTRAGTPVLVLTSYGDVWGLEETLDILRDRDEVKALKRSIDELNAGNTDPL